LSIVLLVGFAWAFLLHLPTWMRRAVIAVALPTLVVLVAVVGPQITTQLFGWGNYRPLNNKFAPYWIATDGQGGIYATDLDGVLVWAVDSSGSPRGTLNAAKAPDVPTPGPGILPPGTEANLGSPAFRLFAPTPTPGRSPSGRILRSSIPNFDFCGVASDAAGNVYLVDLYDPTGYKLLRFDREGNITARWPLPQQYQPTSACVATDSKFLYVSSVRNTNNGMIYVYDHDGKQLQQAQLSFIPMSMSANDNVHWGGPDTQTLLIIGSGSLQYLSVTADSTKLVSLPKPPEPLQVPILLTRSGEVLMSDHQKFTVSRIDPLSGKVVGTIGGGGTMPGQFGDIGGMAEGRDGSVYIADPLNRVIQRFSPDGRVSAVWWALTLNGEVEQEGDKR
jgi:hypothetical protein